MSKKKTVLIVDDMPANIAVLRDLLKDRYKTKLATNGQRALEIAAGKELPDLILLDIMMPEMDGYEVCKHLKKDPRMREIPLIFVTAKAEASDELEGLTLGAVDYITKPFSPPIVLARVEAHLALREARQHVDSLLQTLSDERELIEEIILKMRSADQLDARNLRYLVSPVEETAGDILLSTFQPDGVQLVLLGDFTGHGLPAAIGGPLVGNIFQSMALRGAGPIEILREINSQLCDRLPTGLFFAACLMEVSEDRKKLTVCNAGIPDCLVMRNGKTVQRCPSTIMPLGITNRVDFHATASHVALQTGDRIYSFSDGIIEVKGQGGELFGVERLEAFLSRVEQEDLPLDALLEILADYAGTSFQDDDITMLELVA